MAHRCEKTQFYQFYHQRISCSCPVPHISVIQQIRATQCIFVTRFISIATYQPWITKGFVPVATYMSNHMGHLNRFIVQLFPSTAIAAGGCCLDVSATISKFTWSPMEPPAHAFLGCGTIHGLGSIHSMFSWGRSTTIGGTSAASIGVLCRSFPTALGRMAKFSTSPREVYVGIIYVCRWNTFMLGHWA